MNRKIAFSGMSIVAALTLMGGATFAAFTVNATSNGSTFSSGNPSLQLCNDIGSATSAGDCANQIPNPIKVTNLVPGTSQTFYFWINNTGTDTLSPLSAQFTNPSQSGSNTLEADVDVTISCDGTSGGAGAGPALFHGWETISSLGGSIASGTLSRCSMTVLLPSGNTTDVNQTLNFNAVFSGQDGS